MAYIPGSTSRLRQKLPAMFPAPFPLPRVAGQDGGGHVQGFHGVQGAGRLIATSCSHLDLYQLRGLNQGGKLKLAQGRLQEPDVQWTLVVVRDFGGGKASVRLANVTGRGRAQVRFTGRVDTESTFGATTTGTPRCVDADGLIDELTHFLNGQHSKMQVHVAVQHSGASPDTLQGADLSSDLAKLLEQGVLSDVVLQVQGDKTAKGTDIRAHKAVLAARSPFFQRLFMSDMAESRTSSVSVDFPAAVMEQVLRFAYTGRLDLGHVGAEAGAQASSAQNAQGQGLATEVCKHGQTGDAEATTVMALLAAADYYQLAGLKRLCEERLLQRVGFIPEEALHTLVLADRYGARALKEAALNVAADHLKPLRQRPEWPEFASNHHDLVAELMGVLADKLEQANASLAERRSPAAGVEPHQDHDALVLDGRFDAFAPYVLAGGRGPRGRFG